MIRPMRTRYHPYVNNVTKRHPSGSWQKDKVVWVKGDKIDEKKLAKMLTDAYNTGRKEALREIADAVTEAARA